MLKTIESLSDFAQLDRGVLDIVFSRYLRDLLNDLRDRPAVSQSRVLTMKVMLAPLQDETGALGGVKMEVEIYARGPTSRTRPFAMAAGHKGLEYNDLSPDNAKQKTLDELMET